MKHKDLPLIEEKDIASRNEARTLTLKRSENAVVMDYENITLRTRFNWRRKKQLSDDDWDLKLGIPDLAEGIYTSCGPDDALVGDLLKDGTFVIMEGERRYRAITLLLNRGDVTYPNGNPIAQVDVLLNAKNTTELDRIRKIVTSQEKLSLTPMDKAYGYAKLKEEPYCLSNEKIAEMFRVSRQTIDNYIAATKLPEDVQDRIDADEENITHALKVAREEKKPNLVIVDTETGEIHDDPLQTIPDTYNSDDNQYDRLGGEQPKEYTDKPVQKTDSAAAHEEEELSHITDHNFKETRKKDDRQDALGKIDANAQKSESEMDIDQAIKLMDKLYKNLGDLPNTLKQYKEDMRKTLHLAQTLCINANDRLKRMPSNVE